MSTDRHNLKLAWAHAYLKLKMDEGFIDPFDPEEYTEEELILQAENVERMEQRKKGREIN